MTDYNNKIVLITGGSRGIGAETGKTFIKRGAKVILTDINDRDGQQLADDIGAFYYHLDVTNEEQWIKLSMQIKEEFGKIDIFVNNVGIAGYPEELGPLDPEYSSLDSWQHIYKNNVEGVFLGGKYAIRLMKEHGGFIVNLGSISGVIPIPMRVAYSSGKAAVIHYTKILAIYCANQGYNICCNVINPGIVDDSARWDVKVRGEKLAQRKKMAKDMAPLKRFCTTKDIVNSILYLSSKEANCITGAELNIDSGLTLRI